MMIIKNFECKHSVLVNPHYMTGIPLHIYNVASNILLPAPSPGPNQLHGHLQRYVCVFTCKPRTKLGSHLVNSLSWKPHEFGPMTSPHLALTLLRLNFSRRARRAVSWIRRSCSLSIWSRSFEACSSGPDKCILSFSGA